jgi:hypothetical protein
MILLMLAFTGCLKYNYTQITAERSSMATPNNLPSLHESAHQLGLDLTVPDQTIPDVAIGLNANLAALGCELSVDPDAIKGSWQSYTLRLNTPPFTRLVRAATGGIIMREDTIVPPEPPSPDTTIEELVSATTEGAVWVDERAAKFRKHIAQQNGGLLRAMLDGLVDGGYSERAAKSDMRQEFDELLDSLWTRGSYSSFPEAKVVAAIMRHADVRSPMSTLKAVKRFKGFLKDYGVGLALQRLLPDEVIAELH